MWKEIHSIHLATKAGYLTVHDFQTTHISDQFSKHINDNFTWYKGNIESELIANDYIKEIIIKDLTGNNHSIFKRD
jgi:hypothetical protein